MRKTLIRPSVPLAVALVVALQASAWHDVSPVAWTHDERERLIEVLHTADREALFVAAQLAQFGRAGGLHIALHEVSTPLELLQRVEQSEAALLVIAAHGSTPYPEAGSGLVVGSSVVPQRHLVHAMQRSAAERFVVAACGLDLPASLAFRTVTSYAEPVDMKVAALGALSAIGDVLSDETAFELLPLFERTVAHMASPGEWLRRLLEPLDPLDPPGYYYSGQPYCYSHESQCGWARSDEESLHREASTDGRGMGLAGFDFMEAFEDMRDAGVVKILEDTLGYEWLIRFDFEKCRTIFQVEDLVIPGFSKLLDALDNVPGVKKVEASAFRVNVCGTLEGGFKASGHATVAGELLVQAGTELSLRLKFGRFFPSFTWELWGGLVGAMGLALDGVLAQTWEVTATLRFDLGLEVIGDVGWGSISFGTDLLEWERQWKFRGQSTAANAASSDAPSYEVEDLGILQTLTGANVASLRQRPAALEQLSQALGIDASTLPAGTIVDLRNGDACRAIYGNEAPCANSAPAAAPPTGIYQCLGPTKTPELAGGVQVQAMVCAGPEGVQASITPGSSETLRPLLNVVEPLVPSRDTCKGLSGVQKDACLIVMGRVASAPDLVASRADNLRSVTHLIDLDADPAAFKLVDACAGPVTTCERDGVRVSYRGIQAQAALEIGTASVTLFPVDLQTLLEFTHSTWQNVLRAALDPDELVDDVSAWL